MGYELHITRAEEWSENESIPISLEEWVAYIRSDHEMRLEVIDGYAEQPLRDGRTLRYKCKGRAEWNASSDNTKARNSAWFSFQDGNVVVKDPDEETIKKMCRIAKVLNARVQGDEGEFYGED